MPPAEAALLNREAVIGHNAPPTTAEILADRHAELLAEIGPIAERAASLPKKVTDDIVLGRLGAVVVDARKLLKRIDAKRTEEVAPHLTAQRETNGFFNLHKDTLDELAAKLEGLATDYQTAKAAAERRKLEEEARQARAEQDRLAAAAQAAADKGRQGLAARHDDRAAEAGERAERIEAATKASAADLTRVRTGTGGVASARETWKFEIEDLAAIPLDVLRPFLGREAIEKALGAYVRVNKGDGKLAGVRIFKDTKASFR